MAHPCPQYVYCVGNLAIQGALAKHKPKPVVQTVSGGMVRREGRSDQPLTGGRSVQVLEVNDIAAGLPDWTVRGVLGCRGTTGFVFPSPVPRMWRGGIFRARSAAGRCGSGGSELHWCGKCRTFRWVFGLVRGNLPLGLQQDGRWLCRRRVGRTDWIPNKQYLQRSTRKCANRRLLPRLQRK